MLLVCVTKLAVLELENVLADMSPSSTRRPFGCEREDSHHHSCYYPF